MTRHFQFFNENIKQHLKSDTLNRIGPYWIYLVYPEIIVETKHPYPHSAATNVKIERLNIKPDSYPLFKFLQEHPEFCQSVIQSSPYLNFMFEAWDKHLMQPDIIYMR